MSRHSWVRLASGGAALAALAAVLVAPPRTGPDSGALDTAPAAVTARRIPTSFFGMHPAQLEGVLSADQLAGVTPATGVGAITIVDNGANWRTVQPAQGVYDFTALDSAIDNARSLGVRQINLVLGGTPCWAAAKATVSSEVPRCYASPPKTYTLWRSYVAAVLKHVAPRITSIQVWAEADLPARWAGTPGQLATMTKLAYDVTKWPAVKALNPSIAVASASTTTRLHLRTGSYYDRFYYPYLRALASYSWPINAYVGNFYPPANGTPVTRQKQIAEFKAVLVRAKAPSRPIWEGEVNYGVPGPSGLAYRNLNSTLGAAYLSRTYLDSLRFGIARTYWSAWMPKNNGYGVTTWPGYIGTRALTTTYGWLAGKWFKGCTSSKLSTGVFVTCLVSTTTSSTSFTARVVWSEGTARSYVVPTGVTKLCFATGSCVATARGKVVKVGQLPIWFGR